MPAAARTTIRRAAHADAPAIAEILRHAFDPHKPQYTAAGYRATVLNPDELAARLSEGPIWVAMLDDQPVGTVSVVATDLGLYVRSMSVSPAAQGAGVGRLLLEAVETLARESGISRMYLSTTPFLCSAIRLYERAGFARCAGGPSELHGTPLFTMEKPIDRVPAATSVAT